MSGSHGTGKSTLIAAFLFQRPGYLCEPEAFEWLGDDIALTSDGPDLEGLAALLEHTTAALAELRSGASVVFERSPVDYLAYAAASRAIPADERAELIRRWVPLVREALRSLDLIVLLPARGGPIVARPDENPRFRRRVDAKLREALIDDAYDLFGEAAPAVLELSPDPEEQLAELLRRTGPRAGRS